MTPLPPGSTIGILGGGQLGRMLAMAAARLGYRCHIFAPDETSCAAEISAVHTRANYEDEAALARFADEVDIVTFEFENVPAAPVRELAERVLVRPGAGALELGQDRIAEKDFIAALGGAPAPHRAVASRAGLNEAIATIGVPAMLKTRRGGYDGKGHARIDALGDADAAWKAIDGLPAVLETRVEFEGEFSILLARGVNGETRTWDAPRNAHAEGMLACSTVPASGLILEQVDAATRLARATAEALDYIGVLTLEFFATSNGPIFNELAPRVHNSGHWTIEGAVTSQFENHIRAICGLPLGATDLVADRLEMRNLIGDQAEEWTAVLRDGRAHLHLYGKGAPRAGRKMGHVTRLFGEHI